MATDTSASVLESLDHFADIGNMVVVPMIDFVGDDVVRLRNERFCLYNFTNKNHIEKSFTYKKGEIVVEKSISYGIVIELTLEEMNFVLNHFENAS